MDGDNCQRNRNLHSHLTRADMACTAPKGYQTPWTLQASDQATILPMGPTPSLLPCPLPRHQKGIRPEAATEKVPRVPLARNMRSCLAAAGTTDFKRSIPEPPEEAKAMLLALDGWRSSPGVVPPTTPPAAGGRGTRPGPGPWALASAEASPVRALHSPPSSAPPTLAWTGVEQTLESHPQRTGLQPQREGPPRPPGGRVLGEGRCGAWSSDRAVRRDSGILGMRDPQTRSHLQASHRSAGTRRWCLS